jgi:hypothetical protein
MKKGLKVHTCDLIWKDGVEDFSLFFLLFDTHDPNLANTVLRRNRSPGFERLSINHLQRPQEHQDTDRYDVRSSVLVRAVCRQSIR